MKTAKNYSPNDKTCKASLPRTIRPWEKFWSFPERLLVCRIIRINACWYSCNWWKCWKRQLPIPEVMIEWMRSLMTIPNDPQFNKYYRKHLQCLNLAGLQPKAIEAYSRAIRRISNYFDCRIEKGFPKSSVCRRYLIWLLKERCYSPGSCFFNKSSWAQFHTPPIIATTLLSSIWCRMIIPLLFPFKAES